MAGLRVSAPLGAVVLALSAVPAAALTIVPTYDSSITSMASAGAIQAAFNAVIHDYAISFANPVTVNVTVSWGSVAGYALPSSALGASVDYLYGYYSYGQIRDALAATAAGNPSATALSTALLSMPVTGPAGVSLYAVPSGEAKALGLIPGDQMGPDGYIGFAGVAENYTFNPFSGVAPGTYDFYAVAAHELAEVLGRISGLSSPTATYRTPFDLYRYKSAGVLDFTYKNAAYFSINGGVTKLKNFNAAKTGGDRGDWKISATSNDVQDAFITTGRRYNITVADLTALDVLGWTGANLGNTKATRPSLVAFALDSRAVPEPGLWGLMLAGFGLAGSSLRRRRSPVVA